MKRKTKKLSRQIRKHSEKPVTEKAERFSKDDLVPMGSTLLNLAMSGTIHGGAKKCTMVNIIGASHGGKSMLALTSFAEANRREAFEDYKLIYDDVERANSFDMEYLFGEQTAERIVSARPDKEDEFSVTVQHFHANIKHWIKKGTPFIYVLDSFDALDALEDQKKAEEMIDALEKDKQTAGTYGMAKAKANSSILRNVTSELANSKSVLFIVSQTRDNVDVMSRAKETRSGGRALKFYAHHEMWLKSVGSIKKKDTIVGNRVRVKISKNKMTGKPREVEFDIYDDYGVDDIGSCIDYLLNMKRWTGGGSAKINHQGDFNFDNYTRTKMIHVIESNPTHYKKLQRIVEETWNEFEESIKLNRKRKYD
jgi:recombination protein RecA